MSETRFSAIKVVADPAIPAGDAWLVSGCSWAKQYPELAHGEPEWRVVGMCVHEHLEHLMLCAGCKENLEGWQRTRLELRAPWCARCYQMRPGGHHCTMTVTFKRLGDTKPPC